MNFEYACFLSYRHTGPRNDFYTMFYTALYELLTEQIGNACNARIPVFWDKAAIESGVIAERRIEDALPKSVCMLMIFTNRYFSFENIFCAREFFSMVDIQQHRSAKLASRDPLRSHSMIIPITIQGVVPDFVANTCNPCNFKKSRKFPRYPTDVEKAKRMIFPIVRDEIQDIADTVSALEKCLLKDECPLDVLCVPDFRLLSDEEARIRLQDAMDGDNLDRPEYPY